jgi:hypothetical protein
MKDIEIFFSDFDAGEGERCIEARHAAMDVDLSLLLRHYAALGEKHARNVEKFMPYWEAECENLLLSPKARVLKMPRKAAEKSFGRDAVQWDSSPDAVIIAVWTLGGDLESKSMEMMSSKGDVMTGFLLDVAGSIALYNMHDLLIRWIEAELALPNSKNITEEIYPGLGSAIQDMTHKIETLGNTRETIGVYEQGSSMFYPRKTQYSFVGIGSAKGRRSLRALPCSPCSADKCLYYQLGGCHMRAYPGERTQAEATDAM